MVLFIFSLLGFVASATVNIWTYFNGAYGYHVVLIVMLCVIGFPMAFICNKEDVLDLDVSWGYKIVVILLMIYPLLLFAQPKREAGVIREEGGRYLRQNRGRVIGEASRAAFVTQELHDTKLASSLTMAGFFIAAMISRSRSKEQ